MSKKYLHKDLRDKDFKHKNLNDVLFRGCDLEGVDFTGTKLDRAQFSRCDVSRANFSAALTDTMSFYQCTLENASLPNKLLTAGANHLTLDFIQCYLGGITFPDSYKDRIINNVSGTGVAVCEGKAPRRQGLTYIAGR